MKILLTILATLLTVTALTSSKPQALRRPTSYNVLAANDQRQQPIEKFMR